MRCLYRPVCLFVFSLSGQKKLPPDIVIRRQMLRCLQKPMFLHQPKANVAQQTHSTVLIPPHLLLQTLSEVLVPLTNSPFNSSSSGLPTFSDLSDIYVTAIGTSWNTHYLSNTSTMQYLPNKCLLLLPT